MYAKNCKYGYLPHLKRPLLGGVIILSLSLSSLYAGDISPTKSATTTTTTKTDANGSGIHAKSNSSAIGIAGTNNVTVINRTTIINNYAHPKVVAKKPVTAKAKPIPKTIPKKVVPVVKKAPTVVATSPKKGDCITTHSSDYCNATGKLLNKH